MFRNILAAYDGSEASERAFRAAVDLACAFAGRVHVVAVVELPISTLDVLPTIIEEEQARLEGALGALVRSVPPQRCPIDSEVACGLPTSVLLDRAAAHGVDHIVLGRTGKGAVRRLLLGSVSRDIVGLTKTSVTLIA